MADNVTLPGTGAVIASEEISSVQYQRVKIVLGAVNAADLVIDSGQQTMANSLPVTIASNQLTAVVLGSTVGTDLVKGGGNKTDTTDQIIMATPGSGSFNYLSWLTVYNSSSTNTYVNVKDGSTIVAVIPLAAYGGGLISLPVPIRGSDNAAINLATGASVTTASLYGGGYKRTS